MTALLLEVALGLKLLVPAGGGLPHLPVETGTLWGELLVIGQHSPAPGRVHPVPYPVLPHGLHQGPLPHVILIALVEANLGARTDDPPPAVGARIIGRGFGFVVLLIQPPNQLAGILREDGDPGPSPAFCGSPPEQLLRILLQVPPGLR